MKIKPLMLTIILLLWSNPAFGYELQLKDLPAFEYEIQRFEINNVELDHEYNFWKGRFDPWTQKQTNLFVCFILSDVIDYGQTSWGQAQDPPWIERNFLLGEHPTQNEINRHFVNMFSLSFLFAHGLKSKYRTIFLVCVNMVELNAVYNNYQFGAKLKF